MKNLLGFAFLLAFVLLGSIRLLGQNPQGHVQTFTVTTVSMTIDSITNMDQMNKARGIITKNSEVRDFDIKGRKCNFTLDNSKDKLNVILKDLRTAGYTVNVVRQEDNQTFTSVPVDACDKNLKKDQMSEEEVQELRKTNPDAIGR
jgi:hypothetical protein